MPEFQERDAQHQDWKRAVLAGEVTLPDIDTEPYNRPSLQTPTSKRRASGPT
jgi:hypothetical protein